MFTGKTTYLPNHNPDIRYQNLLLRKFPDYDKIINFIKEETKYCAILKKILDRCKTKEDFVNYYGLMEFCAYYIRSSSLNSISRSFGILDITKRKFFDEFRNKLGR